MAASQTLILTIDLSIAGLLIMLFRREIRREQEEKLLLQHRLTNSFRYIGQANVSLR